MSVARLPVPDPAGPADERRAVLLEVVDRVLGPYAEQATITPEQLAKVLRVGRSAAYQMCRDGRVPVIHVGRSVRVPVPALIALLLGCEPSSSHEVLAPTRDEQARAGPTGIGPAQPKESK